MDDTDEWRVTFERAVVQLRSPFHALASETDPDRALADLDWLAREVSQRRTSLAVHRNATLTISRLPSEVLAHIFHLIMFSCRKPPTTFRVPTTMLSFSQVCKQWRILALSCSTLWTEPIFSWPSVQAGLHLMERALDLPLTIYFLCNQQKSIETLKQLLRSKQSVTCGMHLVAFDYRVLPLLNLDFRPSSLLKELRIIFDMPPHIRPAPLEFDLFSAPLRSLFLTRCVLTKPVQYCATLKTLEISHAGSSWKLSTAAVLAMLPLLPSLERVVIIHALAWHGGSIMHLPIRISMPHLRLLSVHGHVAASVQLAKNILFPLPISLELMEKQRVTASHATNHIVILLDYFMSCPHLVAHPGSLLLSIGAQPGIFYLNAFGLSGSPPNTNGARTHVSMVVNPAVESEALEALSLCAFSIKILWAQRIQELRIYSAASSDGVLSVTGLHALFLQASHVVNLSLSGDAVAPALRGLLLEPQVLLPLLRRLHISQVDLALPVLDPGVAVTPPTGEAPRSQQTLLGQILTYAAIPSQTRKAPISLTWFECRYGQVPVPEVMGYLHRLILSYKAE